MTRKFKIGWSVTAIALVAAAIEVFRDKEERELGINYAGIASNDANCVSFTISNSFKDEMFCDYEMREFVNGEWRPFVGVSHHDIGFVCTRGTTNITVKVPGTNRWQVEVSCTKPWPDNLLYNARANLIYFASDHHLRCLEELLKVGYTWRWSYGPEMLGPKPWTEVQK